MLIFPTINSVESGEGNIKELKPSRMSVWWQALRYHFVPPSIFPATLGALIAWAVDHTFYLSYFFLVLLGVVVNHIALNMADDYFDFKHAVDQSRSEEKNPYSGGSGTLSSGLIRPQAMRKAFVLCFAITVAIGLYLTVSRGFPVLLFGLLGVFCSVFYTAPPISFSHHGLGELSQLVCFGTVIGLGSYFVQTQKLTLEAFLATLPLGIMLFSMIIINEIPDYDEDRLAGKLTLVARYGKQQGLKLYMASWTCTYLVIIGGVLLQVLPLTTLLAFVSLPLALRSIHTLRANYENPSKLAPANLDMLEAHSVTALGLIAAYSIQGLTESANSLQLFVALLLLAVFYVPAVVTLRKTAQSRK
jgi:1,4-dihydroxy-2-naphthoate octaprenyltransferase